MRNSEIGKEVIKKQLPLIPKLPGVYKMLSINNEILYVGKAKNLKKRVASYFNKNLENHKTKVLLKKIKRVENIVVESEMDALLLENNLIKKYTFL